jgi:uncharacterized membrane protein
MTYVQATPAIASGGSARWLLLGSLALNLFFVGIAVARDRNVFVRVERLAATLPPSDGDLLRGEIKANRDAIEQAQTNYRGAQDAIRETLRQDAFDAGAMRAAMAKARAARQTFDQTVQGMFAEAAAQMSSAGRHALADWPPGRKSASNRQ